MKALAAILAAGAWLAVLPAPVFPDQPPDGRFLEAQRAYDNSDYPSALALYDPLAREYPREAEIHFNRGNTLARLGQWGDAIAAYHRTLLLRPRDADVKANLHFIRERAGLPAPRRSAVERIAGGLSRREWETACAVSWWIFCAAWALHHGLPRKAQWVRRIGLSTGLLLIAALMGWALSAHQARRPLVVVRAPGTKALFAPIASATPHFDAPEGLTARLIQRNGAWLEIRSDRRDGWIPRASAHIVTLDDGRGME